MRIGLMIPTLLHGGAERAICRLSDILSAAGHKVYLIVFDASKQYYSYSGELIDLQLPNGRSRLDKIRVFRKRLKAVQKAISDNCLDVTISFIAGATFVNSFVRSKAKRIVSQRNFLSKESDSALKKRLLQYCFRRADAVVAVAELCRLDLIENFRIPPHKVHTIYNAYDQRQIIDQMVEPIAENHQRFFDRHEFNLVTVGRPEYQKGFWNLLKVLYLVRKRGFDCGLTLVGEGSQMSKLETLRVGLQLEEHVQFAGYQSNPYAYVGKADVYVMTSLFEGFPNALTEAMCCGKAIVSTDCPSGPREILQGNQELAKRAETAEFCNYGVLVPGFSEVERWESDTFEEAHEIMAQAICELLSNDKRREELGTRAQERSKSFSYRACLQAYERLLQEV